MCSGMVWHLPPGQGQAFCDTRQPISSIAGATKWAIPMITEEASDAGSRGFWQARTRLKPGAKLLFRLLLSTLWISKTRLYTCWFRNGYSFEISKWFFLKLENKLETRNKPPQQNHRYWYYILGIQSLLKICRIAWTRLHSWDVGTKGPLYRQTLEDLVLR